MYTLSYFHYDVSYECSEEKISSVKRKFCSSIARKFSVAAFGCENEVKIVLPVSLLATGWLVKLTIGIEYWWQVMLVLIELCESPEVS